MRVIALGLLLLLVTACSEPGGWIGDDPHVVDGYWVITETPCRATSGDECEVAVQTAIAALGVEPGMVAATWTARWPTSYQDGHGGTFLATYAGLSQPTPVILDLVDGTRQLVSVMCAGPIMSDDGSLVSPRTCGLIKAPDDDRVGYEPWRTGP